ncbi:hypothetical protein SDC9_45961 [bioreactor metagenome]|uniref:Uncharacterized protein n=1 Tax=bioreactor metagenome TaxID=1076179 RepID=A0A644W8E1_9ZZZZ
MGMGMGMQFTLTVLLGFIGGIIKYAFLILGIIYFVRELRKGG